jgi:hypothetical protein
VRETEQARRIAEQAVRAAGAQRAVVEARQAAEAVAMPNVARRTPTEDQGGPRYWCPLLGCAARSCACGTPQGSEGCDHLTRRGDGGRGEQSGAVRVARRSLDAAVAAIEAAEAEAAAQVGALEEVAGAALATWALAAARAAGGDVEMVAMVLCARPAEPIPPRPAVEAAPALPTRRERKAREAAALRPAAEVAAAAAGRVAGALAGWVDVRAARAMDAARVALAPVVAEVRVQVGGRGRHGRHAQVPAWIRARMA